MSADILSLVIAGLVPAIPFGVGTRVPKDRDGRHEAGHDGENRLAR